MPERIPYKSFCWKLGTTSFRTKNFNKMIEQQLKLLNEFWYLGENSDESWDGNSTLQTAYYDFMLEKGFVEGDADNKPKDAREKTSGLADIGVINDDRTISEVGYALLDVCSNNDFTPDNFFNIPKDSYIYLKQLLKSCSDVSGKVVRPYVVMLYVLSKVKYLTTEEFTYLLPLCVDKESTEEIIQNIALFRGKQITVDDIIISRLMNMDNYADALRVLMRETDINEDVICTIGLNRKSRIYDKPYYELYKLLEEAYLYNNSSKFIKIRKYLGKINISTLWRKYLFNTISMKKIEDNPLECLNNTLFDNVQTEDDFKLAFFKVMHLLKARATLADYYDLNRRYIGITDTVLFEDGTVKLDIIPKHFFNSSINELYNRAYSPSTKLFEDCDLIEISPNLITDEQIVIDGVNAELGTNISTISEARNILEKNRYVRFNKLIDAKFNDEQIIELLELFEQRNDEEIQKRITYNADVPTIFEYVLGIAWYKISEKQGKILDYMKLSFDADLLPKTHASGGEADIVYEYSATDAYPAHSMLIEATLADSTNQRKMEMEPVSRHLGQHLLKTVNLDSYCVFATNCLNVNVISDFRGRKSMLYCDTQDFNKYVEGMKIIPIEIAELKTIITKQYKYKELYTIFCEAFISQLQHPRLWYDECIKNKL